jgi:MurNAc alpha-1-phosphate uridylyltransferase
MKAMILAAGRGERMRPLTDKTPKPLLKVAGKRLIEYHIEKLVAANITELIINHAWLGQQIEACLGNGSRYGASITYSPEAEALETAGGIVNALPLLGSEPFVVVNGDVFTDYDYRSLQSYAGDMLVHLILVNNPEHNPDGDFFLQDPLVLNQPETDKPVLNRYTFSGIARYHPEFFTVLEPGKQPLAPLLRAAMDRHLVSGEVHQGLWLDIGTPARLEELNRNYLYNQS